MAVPFRTKLFWDLIKPHDLVWINRHLSVMIQVIDKPNQKARTRIPVLYTSRYTRKGVCVDHPGFTQPWPKFDKIHNTINIDRARALPMSSVETRCQPPILWGAHWHDIFSPGVHPSSFVFVGDNELRDVKCPGTSYSSPQESAKNRWDLTERWSLGLKVDNDTARRRRTTKTNYNQTHWALLVCLFRI